MAQPLGLGTIYDNSETTIQVPLVLPAGTYLIKVRQEDGSRTQEKVVIDSESTFSLKNYNGHKKLGLGTNIISVFSNANERFEFSGYDRWALKLKEATSNDNNNPILFENLRHEYLLGEKNGVNTVFTVSEIPKKEFFKLWRNGQFLTILDTSNFILTENTKTITLGFAPDSDEVIVVEYFKN